MTRHVEPGVAARGGRRHPVLLRRVVAGSVVVLTASVVLAGADWSQAAGAQQVLQAVNISLGSDGSITRVAATDIRKDQPGFSTDTTSYAPGDVAGSLPVGVTVSALKDGVPSSDIDGLAHQSGLIEVDVTVTNKTVRPTSLSYPVDGVQHTQQALVGTPLTVTATATLPKGSFASLVQSTPGTSDPHTTNGVVGADAHGASTVGWAALLAPPALSGTTTFALVERATHFQLPSFTLTVAPGMSTDPSVDNLLTSTFGSANPLLATQNQAISLVNQIDATLDGVAGDLHGIQGALAATAGGIGQQATDTLSQAGAEISGTSQQLAAELAQLQSTVSDSVSKAGTDADASLRATVAGLVSYIGLPGDPAPAARALTARGGPAPSCTLTPAAGAAPTTLLGQLTQVSDLLTAAGGATSACIPVLQQALSQTIGDSGTTCDPAQQGVLASASVTCNIEGTQHALTTAEGDVGSALTGLDAPLADTGTALTTLQATLTTLGDDLSAAVGTVDSHGATASTGTLQTLVQQITGYQSSPQGAGSDLAAAADAAQALTQELSSVSATAGDRLAALGSAPGSATSSQRTTQNQLAYAASSACASFDPTSLSLGSGYPAGLTPQQAADLTSLLLVGTDCAGKQPLGSTDLVAVAAYTAYTATHGSVADQVGADVSAWTTVQHDIAGLDVSTLPSLLDPVHGTLATLLDGLVPGSTHSDATAASLHQLEVLAQALAASKTSTDCAGGSPQQIDAGCLAAVSTALAQAQTAVGGPVGDADSSLDSLDTSARSAGDAAKSTVASLLTSLGDALTGTATTELTQGTAALVAQQATLLQHVAGSTAALDAATRGAITQLDQSVGAADAGQSATTATLAQLVAAVQADLGSGADGSHQGILGAIRSNATETGIGADAIGGATGTASAFRGVREAAVADNVLVQQQLQAGLGRAQAFPVFGPPLPAGSTHTTVFVYHLAAIG